MKVSVIVTTYNRPDALKKVLDGLLHQTRFPSEILVADDGSNDATRQMLEVYIRYPQIRILHVRQEDKGFRAARIRNKAVVASKGDYLILLDGDCIPEKHFVQDHESLAQKGCFFQGKRVLVNRSAEDKFDHTVSGSGTRRVVLAFKKGLSNRHHIFRIPFFPSHTTTRLSGVRSCNMGIFKDNLVAVNGFNHAFKGWGREDSELVVRLYKYGLKRKENPFKAICYHLWHKENDRAGLEKNDALLQQVIDSPSYECRAGLNELV